MKRSNSYDFIRLCAATMVVFSHSFVVTGHHEPLIGGVSFGSLGVWIFFILSGYLISISWDQYPRFNVFFAKRGLRIFPGLAINLLLTVLILGLFYSTLPFWEYITHNSTLAYFNNLFLYDRQSSLPGVFTNNIFPISVNPSLWTLPYEFTMYIAVALIGVFKIYKKISVFNIWLFLFALECIVLYVGPEHLHITLFYLRLDRILLLALLFFTGVVFHKYTHKIILSYAYGGIALFLFIVLCLTAPVLSPLFGATLLAYGIFSLGRSSFASKLNKVGDLSYGVYIYSFPIQQIISYHTQTTRVLYMFFLSVAISYVIAYVSWRFIESRALKLKGAIKTERYPLDQTTKAW